MTFLLKLILSGVVGGDMMVKVTRRSGNGRKERQLGRVLGSSFKPLLPVPSLLADEDMAEISLAEPMGPRQSSRARNGLYVYWVTMGHPRPETVEEHGVKVPGDFDRNSFWEIVVKVHGQCGVTVVEAASFQELHENGLRHHNCLVRSVGQYRWRPVAQKLRDEYEVCVDFASNIRTWAEGVIYGRVASEPKSIRNVFHG